MIPSMLPLLAVPALAANVIDMAAMTTVPHGQQTPYLEFRIGSPGQLHVDLTCSGKTWNLDQRVSDGDAVKLELKGIKPGIHDCTGGMTFELDRGEEVSQNLAISVASLDAVEWNISYAEDYHRDAKNFTAHSNRPLVQAEASFIGAHGKQIDFVVGDLSDPTAPNFSWKTDETIVKIEVTATDEANFRAILEVFPYFYNIPHEDPVFASGSHAINPSEVAKLQDTWSKIQGEFDLYGEVIQMHLYVAGYTDTVGSASSNQSLSERRAKSIAQWFRQQGFPGDVYYQGFGEEGQAKPTGDNVDEPANRRVLYFLANQQPPPSNDLPRANWRKL